MRRWLGRIWRWIKLIYLFLLPARFSLLAVVIVGWAFLLSAQGLDILRALVEYDPCKKIHPHILRMLAFVLATNAFAYQTWYWTRQILRVKPPKRIDQDKYFAYPPPPEFFPRTTILIPRFLGALGFVIPLLAFFRIGRSYSADPADAVQSSVRWMILWLVLSLLAFLVFVVLRRYFLSRPQAARQEGGARKFDRRAEAVRSLEPRDPWEFDPSTKIFLIATLVVEAVFFVWATRNPVSMAPLGSGFLVLLTAALWIPFGTVLVLLGIRLRFPILAALFVWALLWSPVADWNHVIRALDDSGAGPVDDRRDAVQQLEEWYQRVKRSGSCLSGFPRASSPSPTCSKVETIRQGGPSPSSSMAARARQRCGSTSAPSVPSGLTWDPTL